VDARLTPADACAEPSPQGLLRGIKQFNRGEFFECHETLERLWLQERRPVRELYQGILQVGVGFYHLKRGNYRGGLLTLDRGLGRLRPLPPICQGVAVGQLVAEAEQVRIEVVARGPDGLNRLAEVTLPHVRLIPATIIPG
jgi:uncharacterized protein